MADPVGAQFLHRELHRLRRPCFACMNHSGQPHVPRPGKRLAIIAVRDHTLLPPKADSRKSPGGITGQFCEHRHEGLRTPLTDTIGDEKQAWTSCRLHPGCPVLQCGRQFPPGKPGPGVHLRRDEHLRMNHTISLETLSQGHHRQAKIPGLPQVRANSCESFKKTIKCRKTEGRRFRKTPLLRQPPQQGPRDGTFQVQMQVDLWQAAKGGQAGNGTR